VQKESEHLMTTVLIKRVLVDGDPPLYTLAVAEVSFPRYGYLRTEQVVPYSPGYNPIVVSEIWSRIESPTRQIEVWKTVEEGDVEWEFEPDPVVNMSGPWTEEDLGLGEYESTAEAFDAALDACQLSLASC
jgi:hypothetical protein